MSQNHEPMSFNLTRVEIPVTIGDRKFTLREASGNAEIQYRNSMFQSTKLDEDGNAVGYTNLADAEPLLVSLCLFDEQSGNPSVQEVREWPTRIISPLFDKIQEISDMGATEDNIPRLEKMLERAKKRAAGLKKEPASTETGSS